MNTGSSAKMRGLTIEINLDGNLCEEVDFACKVWRAVCRTWTQLEQLERLTIDDLRMENDFESNNIERTWVKLLTAKSTLLILSPFKLSLSRTVYHHFPTTQSQTVCGIVQNCSEKLHKIWKKTLTSWVWWSRLMAQMLVQKATQTNPTKMKNDVARGALIVFEWRGKRSSNRTHKKFIYFF